MHKTPTWPSWPSLRAQAALSWLCRGLAPRPCHSARLPCRSIASAPLHARASARLACCRTPPRSNAPRLHAQLPTAPVRAPTHARTPATRACAQRPARPPAPTPTYACACCAPSSPQRPLPTQMGSSLSRFCTKNFFHYIIFFSLILDIFIQNPLNLLFSHLSNKIFFFLKKKIYFIIQ